MIQFYLWKVQIIPLFRIQKLNYMGFTINVN